MPPTLDSCDILILDDDDILAEFVATVLERRGADASWVQNGAAGVDRVARQPPDLVVSDWRMPGQSGLDVLRRIRDTTDAVAFLMMSAYHTPSLRQACTRAKADAYLQKPFGPSDLIESARLALRA